jgi:hypothetical protein
LPLLATYIDPKSEIEFFQNAYAPRSTSPNGLGGGVQAVQIIHLLLYSSCNLIDSNYNRGGPDLEVDIILMGEEV